MSPTEKTVVAFDPGAITGIAVGMFSDDVPLVRVDMGAITYQELLEGFDHLLDEPAQYIVVEKFESRSGQDFAPDLTPVRVEGLLDLAFGDRIVWRSPSLKSQVPDRVLKDNDLLLTGTHVDWEDARDVNDATIHMLGFVAFTLQHRPTLEKYFRKATA